MLFDQADKERRRRLAKHNRPEFAGVRTVDHLPARVRGQEQCPGFFDLSRFPLLARPGLPLFPLLDRRVRESFLLNTLSIFRFHSSPWSPSRRHSAESCVSQFSPYWLKVSTPSIGVSNANPAGRLMTGFGSGIGTACRSTVGGGISSSFEKKSFFIPPPGYFALGHLGHLGQRHVNACFCAAYSVPTIAPFLSQRFWLGTRFVPMSQCPNIPFLTLGQIKPLSILACPKCPNCLNEKMAIPRVFALTFLKSFETRRRTAPCRFYCPGRAARIAVQY